MEEQAVYLAKKNEDSLQEFIQLSSRYSKNLAKNIYAFKTFSNEDLSIDLTAYILDYCQKNYPALDGFYYFDYEVFCKIFGHDPSNLFRHYTIKDTLAYLNGETVAIKKIPTIVILEKESVDIDELFDKNKKGAQAFSTCALGNAFYELHRKPISLSGFRIVTKDKSSTEFHGKELKIITEYVVSYDKNRHNKTLIGFKPNEDLLFNNFKQFSLIDINSFKNLNLSSKKLFIFLSNEINELRCNNENTIRIETNEGCRICNINQEEPRQNKKFLKKKLDTVNALLHEDDRFIYLPDEKVSPDSRHRFMLCLQFPNIKPYSKKDLSDIYGVQYKNYYQKALYDNYTKFYRTINDGTNAPKLSFADWRHDNELNLEHKKMAYMEAQAVVYNRILKADDFEVLKEFTISVTRSIEDGINRLLKDPNIVIVKNHYGFKVANKIVPLKREEICGNKFLNKSIETFLKANPTYKQVAFSEEKNMFFAVVK